MTPETALKTRENMLRDGYCVIDDILTDEFLEELREESERLIANHYEHEEFRYQGQHVNVRGADNPIIQIVLTEISKSSKIFSGPSSTTSNLSFEEQS